MSITREEVMKLLIDLKRQLDLEMLADMKKMEERIIARITESDKKTEAVKLRTVELVAAKMAEANNQITIANNQLATVQQAKTRELVIKAVEKMGEQVYDKVTSEIVPKMNAAKEWLDYSTQDGEEVVDMYRRAVEHRHRTEKDQKLLTSGENSKKLHVSDHVRLFWSEDD